MNSNSYDVAIIGAGISGLVAGNYLAQAGLKVFSAGQQYAVGGCCSFFKRKGFTFECGAHSLGSCRKPDGRIYQIFRELGIYDILDIKRADCSDTIVTKARTINFLNGVNQMAETLSQEFENYRTNIYDFFKEIDGLNSQSFTKYYVQYEKISFDQFLSKFFKQKDIKEILSIFLGNLGVASDEISAITALTLYKEYLLDGGYYVPKGGMQRLGDVLRENFKKNGGTISLRDKVVKIHVENEAVTGIETEKKGFCTASYVISTAGIKQPFFQLIDRKWLPDNLCLKANNLKPSVSALILYLGLKGSTIKEKAWGRTVWYVPNLNANDIYRKTLNGDCDEEIEVAVIGLPSNYDETLDPPGHESLRCIVMAPFKNEEFWSKNKTKYKEIIINRLSEIIPDLRERIVVSELASPSTMRRYTLNDDGAIYGLASRRDQVDYACMPQKTPVKNLFLSSHWATIGVGQGGTPMAAFAGRQVARLIEAKKTNKKDVAWAV